MLIAGPTASGKSALALALAQRLGGIVVNADSMQVYRDLRVITARPSQHDESQVPHRLYGHVDAAENYSVGRWLRDISVVLDEAGKEGRLPIIVGGTGLYFRALTRGLAAIPPVPAEIRKALRARLDVDGAASLRAELMQRDPVAAQRIAPGDGTRILRALEVIETTGRALDEWHRENTQPLVDPGAAVKIFLAPERNELNDRIDRRFEAMLASAALDEVRALDARNLDPRLPAMKAHGVPWLRKYLNGEMTLEEASAMATRDTRAYSKRQFTWFRHQMPGWLSASPDKNVENDVYDLAR